MVDGRPVAPSQSITIEKLDSMAELLKSNGAIEVTRIEVPKPAKPAPVQSKPAPVPVRRNREG
jgi:hypothetical protein